MDEDENVRLPDSIFRDRLVDNIEDDFDFDYELEAVVKRSRIDYEEKLKRDQEIENIKNHRRELFKRLDMQISYLSLQKNEYILFFIDCFNCEKERFLNGDNELLYLFKGHWDFFKNFLNDIYTLPKMKNKKPKIDDELFILLEQVLSYY